MRKKIKPSRRGRPGNLTMQFAARFMAMTQAMSENHARALLRDEGKSHLSPDDWYTICRAIELPEIKDLQHFTEVMQELGIGVGWKG